MAAEPLPISFDDLYVGRGTLDMAFHPQIAALNGRTVVLTGVLAPSHGHETAAAPHSDARDSSGAPLLLMDEVGQCPDCAAAPIATVQLSGLAALPAPAVPGLTKLTVAGVLEFGFAVDATGHASFVRLTAAQLVS